MCHSNQIKHPGAVILPRAGSFYVFFSDNFLYHSLRLEDEIGQDQAPTFGKGFSIVTKELAGSEPVIPGTCAVFPGDQAVAEHKEGIPFREAYRRIGEKFRK